MLRFWSVPTPKTKPHDSVRLYPNPMCVDAVGFQKLMRALDLARH